MKIIGASTAVVEADRDWSFTRNYAGEEVNAPRESFLVSDLFHGENNYGC